MFRVANQLSGTQVQTPRAPEVADGDPAANALHCGTSNSSTPSRSCAARLAALRQGDAGVVLQCIHNRCCHHGVPVSIMGKTSAQLAQWAGTLLKRSPPNDNGNVCSFLVKVALQGSSKCRIGIATLSHRGSWQTVRPRQGLNTLSWQFARAEAQDVGHARDRLKQCTVFSRWWPPTANAQSPRDPEGCPVGWKESLTLSTHELLRSNISARLCSSSQAGGFLPDLFQTCDLPEWILILALSHNSRSAELCRSPTLLRLGHQPGVVQVSKQSLMDPHALMDCRQRVVLSH